MSFLENIKNKVETVSIKELLHRRMAGYEKARSIKTIHASDVSNLQAEFCPRYIALLEIHGAKPKDYFVGTSMRWTFDNGHDVQKRLNEDWLADVMVGHWRHRATGEMRYFCIKPEGKLWEYIEVRFKSKVSHIDCGLDALVRLEKTGKLKLVEVKTMAKDEFGKLQAPLAEHRLRTRIYMKLISESGDPNAEYIDQNEARVLYVCRGFGIKDDTLASKGIQDAGFSPFKEYVVTRNDQEIEPYLQKGVEVRKFRESGVIPAGVCPTALAPRAKYCSQCKHCFSGSYPAGSINGGWHSD